MAGPCAPAGTQVGSAGVPREQVAGGGSETTPCDPVTRLLGPLDSPHSGGSLPPVLLQQAHGASRIWDRAPRGRTGGGPAEPLAGAQEAARAGALLTAHRRGNCPELLLGDTRGRVTGD